MSHKDINELNVSKMYQMFGHKTQYQNIMSVFELLLTLPASSAEVERGFSRLKFVKNDRRSLLSESHLNDLMMITLETPEIGLYDPMPAINAWNTAGIMPPRLTFGNKMQKPLNVVVVADGSSGVVVEDVVTVGEGSNVVHDGEIVTVGSVSDSDSANMIHEGESVTVGDSEGVNMVHEGENIECVVNEAVVANDKNDEMLSDFDSGVDESDDEYSDIDLNEMPILF